MILGRHLWGVLKTKFGMGFSGGGMGGLGPPVQLAQRVHKLQRRKPRRFCQRMDWPVAPGKSKYERKKDHQALQQPIPHWRFAHVTKERASVPVEIFVPVNLYVIGLAQ